MKPDLAWAIYLIGWGQLSVLVASAFVPMRLDWHRQLAPLPRLVRQLFWVYGGYIVLAIVGLGTICIVNADELASGTRLAKSYCAFGTLFWGIRLGLQPFLHAKPFLTTWWLRGGYHLLTLLFASFVVVLGWGAIR